MLINMTEYEKRRKTLMQKVGKDSVVILAAASEVIRNGDALYPFRQNSDFYYLTGFAEPDAIMVLLPKRKAGEFILFNRIRDKDREIWDGPRAGQQGAVKHYRADEAFPISRFKNMLPELLAGRSAVHFPIGKNKKLDKTILQALNTLRASIRSGLEAPTTIVDTMPTLHEMRLFKSEAEIEAIQKAVDITGRAHVMAMGRCQPGRYEYELEAEIMYEFIRCDGRFPAYNSIVGSGRNSCILHYVSNDKKIAAGELVLIDAGCEYQHYAADITRTFPANGKFSAEQKIIYELVLAAQKAGIKAVKPGASFMAPQAAIVKIITEGLVELGLLRGSVDTLIEKQAYIPFYMHRSGHWLGLDVHDVGQYRINNKWRPFEPGMVLTVEPGLYISEDLPVHQRWHNIGVRIEDDVLVTSSGRRVLSENIPKQIDEIESIMRRN